MKTIHFGIDSNYVFCLSNNSSTILCTFRLSAHVFFHFQGYVELTIYPLRADLKSVKLIASNVVSFQGFFWVVGDGAFRPYVGEILHAIFHFGGKIVRVFSLTGENVKSLTFTA